jgi:hypothetical protein
MSFVFLIAAMACMLGVVLSLLGGLFAMTKNGTKARQGSNKMMQARVALQGLAVLFLFLFYLSNH